MKTRFTAVISIIITITLLSLTGCNLPVSEQDTFQTSVAGTVAAENATLPSAEPVDIHLPPPEMPTPTLTATLNPTFTPTITLSPTITPTSTLEAPMVSVSTNTNCRTGPGTVYDIKGALLVGEQAEVVGKGEFGNYWIIKNPDGSGECWLWGNYATVTGPTDGLTIYTPPPTPTPAFDWSGKWGACYKIDDALPCESSGFIVNTNGKTFTGTATTWIVTISYSGTISDDFMSVSGTWDDGMQTGSFKLYAIGVDQFNGHEKFGDGSVDGMCGSRVGAGSPSPCYRP